MAIMFKTVYTEAIYDKPKYKEKLDMIVSLLEKHENFGCQKPEEVIQLVEVVRFPLLKLYLTCLRYIICENSVSLVLHSNF